MKLESIVASLSRQVEKRKPGRRAQERAGETHGDAVVLAQTFRSGTGGKPGPFKGSGSATVVRHSGKEQNVAALIPPATC